MKKIVFYSLLLTSFLLLSCPDRPADGREYVPLPQGILVDITAENEMGTQVAVKIRHKYRRYWYEVDGLKNQITYTEWTTEHLDGGVNKKIGVEKTPQSDTKSTWEASGFILLDQGLRFFAEAGVKFESTFEMEIETADNTFLITGDMITSGSEPNETYLCMFMTGRGVGGRWAWLYTYKQQLRTSGQFTSFVLPVNLTIKPDGSWIFEHDDVQESKGIIVTNVHKP